MERFYLSKGLVIEGSGTLWELVGRSHEEIYFKDPLTGVSTVIREGDFWSRLAEGSIKIKKALSNHGELRFKVSAKLTPPSICG
ncbi:hypothetical protein [Cupriavidus sp. TMH.W2]|uniref:hypothetical protein n=1 Tax=Cupriavidus sp. TMH.W2 TaxID=3434465 RepID=UPI003D774590